MNIDYEAIIKLRQHQKVNMPYGTKDVNFPLFKTPVNEKLLVYIPTVNLVKNADGTEYNDLLYTALHSYNKGKQFGSVACISGLDADNPVSQMLGYSGHTCPACDAVNECWTLVNKKVEARAKEIGIDPNNDPNEILKPARQQFIKEMALSRATEYVTFPIVVIPHKDLSLTEESIRGMKAYYVTLSRQRYEEKVCSQLATFITNPGHIAGRFMLWDFTYDTKGAVPNARDSARLARFMILTDATALQVFEPLRSHAEELAKDFTNVKALQVLTAIEPQTYDTLTSNVNSIMQETRKLLSILDVDTSSSTVALQSPEKALESFGVQEVTPIAPTATAVGQQAVTTQPQTPAVAPAQTAYTQTMPNMGVGHRFG